uniref:PPUP9740 n=1 Tax=Poeciliopsis prolifica TaxID=188132 RepID=A0A0S7EQ30_9TELE
MKENAAFKPAGCSGVDLSASEPRIMDVFDGESQAWLPFTKSPLSCESVAAEPGCPDSPQRSAFLNGARLAALLHADVQENDMSPFISVKGQPVVSRRARNTPMIHIIIYDLQDKLEKYGNVFPCSWLNEYDER